MCALAVFSFFHFSFSQVIKYEVVWNEAYDYLECHGNYECNYEKFLLNGSDADKIIEIQGRNGAYTYKAIKEFTNENDARNYSEKHYRNITTISIK